MALRQNASTGEMIDDGKGSSVQAMAEITSTDGRPTMHVKVYSPFKVYFNQQAYSVTGENATGPFDILPHHHNFITLLNPCELILRTESGEPKVKISGGVMHVKSDQVSVFLDV